KHAAREPRRSNLLVDPVELLGQQPIEALYGHGSAIARACAVPQPLPKLRAADLRGGGVLHEVVKRHTPAAAQPCLYVLHADANAASQSAFGDLTVRHAQQVARGYVDFAAQHLQLIRPAHDGVESLARDLRKPRMRDPGAIVSRMRFAQL